MIWCLKISSTLNKKYNGRNRQTSSVTRIEMIYLRSNTHYVSLNLTKEKYALSYGAPYRTSNKKVLDGKKTTYKTTYNSSKTTHQSSSLRRLISRLITRLRRLISRLITRLWRLLSRFTFSRVADGGLNRDSRWKTGMTSLNITLIWDMNKRNFFHVFCWYMTRTWVLGSWGEFLQGEV